MPRKQVKSTADERANQLEAMEQLLLKHGITSLARPLAQQPIKPVSQISTQSISVDWATVGGVPRGRITEFYGSEASGKTTLALHVAAGVQRAGGMVGFIDAEYTLDPAWASINGVNMATLRYAAPDFGEQALDTAEIMAGSGAIDLIIIDSVAALVPHAVLEGKIEAQFVGVQARMMSRATQRLAGIIGRANVGLIFINQLRANIGAAGYGPSETTPGGRALKFAASLRVDIRRRDAIKQGEEEIGREIRVKVTKNKSGPPMRQVIIPLLYATGIDLVGELLDLGVRAKAIDKRGAYYYISDSAIGQGRVAAREWLMNHPDVQAALRPRLVEFLETGALGPELDGEDTVT